MAKKIEKRNSKIHGKGVFATKTIKKGDKVVRYKGRLLKHDKADEIYGESQKGHTFLFILNDKYVVDANVDGNVARWINHGCDPNCEAIIYEHEGGNLKKDKVIIEALRKINVGEELVYNYRISFDGRMTKKERAQWICKCGSPKCTGTMLEEAT